MLKNQVNVKTHPKNFNDKYHDFHCTQNQSVLRWEGFKDSFISADSDHERVGIGGGGGGGGGAQMSRHHQGALVYIAA